MTEEMTEEIEGTEDTESARSQMWKHEAMVQWLESEHGADFDSMTAADVIAMAFAKRVEWRKSQTYADLLNDRAEVVAAEKVAKAEQREAVKAERAAVREAEAAKKAAAKEAEAAERAAAKAAKAEQAPAPATKATRAAKATKAPAKAAAKAPTKATRATKAAADSPFD